MNNDLHQHTQSKCKNCGIRNGSHSMREYLKCWKELQVTNLPKANVSEFTGL